MFGAPSSCALHDLSGNPEETLEEELQPKQQREMFEGAKENHVGSEHVGVSVLGTPTDELPSREQEFATEEVEEVVQEHSIAKDDNIVLTDSSPNLQAATSFSEENPSETLAEQVLLETNNSDVVEVERKGMWQVCGGDTNESCTVSEHQVDEEKKLAVSKSEPQTDPQRKEEADNDETEETAPRSQGAPAPGKKKKKKKRTKKKGVHEEEGKRQANQEKCSEEGNTESTATGDRSQRQEVTEPVIGCSTTKVPVELSTDRAGDKQDRKESEEVELSNPTESCTPNETIEESVVKDDKAESSEPDNNVVEAPPAAPGFDHVPDQALDGKNDELNLDIETVEAAVGVEIFETPRESRTEAKEEERDDGPAWQTASVEAVAAEEANEASSDMKPSEPTTAAGAEQQDDEETPETLERSEASCAPEESFSNSEGVDNSESVLTTDGVDRVCVPAVAECLGERGDSNQAESGKVEDAGEDEHVGEIPTNRPNMEAEESDTEACVLGDHSISTNRSDGKDHSSASPPSGDGSESSSGSEPPSQPPAGEASQDEVTEEGDERSNGGEDGGEESSPPTLDPPSKPAEELKVEAEVPSEPSGSSGEEQSERLAADVDALLESEKSLEAAEQAEQLGDAENQGFLCKDQTDEAFSDTPSALNKPDSQPAEALHQCPGDEQEPSKEASTTPEDSAHELSQKDLLGGPITDGSEGHDSVQPSLQESEDEDEGGQSFDFDDIDVEMAVTADVDGVEQGVEVWSDDYKPGGSGACQSSTNSKENTSSGPAEDEECVVAAGQRSDTQDTAAVTVEGESSKSLNQTCSSPVEEGLDALEQLQSGDLVLEKSPDPVVQNAEPPQASGEPKKNSKKGKAKGKEECKVS